MESIWDAQTGADNRRSNWSLSEFLNLLDLRGQTWCIVELRGSAGFNLPGDDGVTFYGVLRARSGLRGWAARRWRLAPGKCG